MNTQRIALDVSKAATPAPVVRIGQGDASGTTIVATVYDNGVAADLSGMSAVFCMRLPNGRNYVRDPRCDVSGSTVTYVVDESHCAAVAGSTDEAYLEILQGGSLVYSTQRFRVVVLRSVLDGAVPTESWDTAIDALIRRGDAAVDRANAAAEAAEDVASLTVPMMSTTVRGGAKLGDGLALTGEALGVAMEDAAVDSAVAAAFE